jgi:hypothetical protein
VRADRRVSFPYILTSQYNGNEDGGISNRASSSCG